MARVQLLAPRGLTRPALGLFVKSIVCLIGIH